MLFTILFYPRPSRTAALKFQLSTSTVQVNITNKKADALILRQNSANLTTETFTLSRRFLQSPKVSPVAFEQLLCVDISLGPHTSFRLKFISVWEGHTPSVTQHRRSFQTAVLRRTNRFDEIKHFCGKESRTSAQHVQMTVIHQRHRTV